MNNESSPDSDPPLTNWKRHPLLKSIRHIAILHTDFKRSYYHTENEYISDSDVKERSETICKILQKYGFNASVYKWGNDFINIIKKDDTDLVINLVESIRGDGNLVHTIPAFFELFGISYTGSGSTSLNLNSNKFLTKELLKEYGVPTPGYTFITDRKDHVPKSLKYPLIVKLNTHLGGSIGIDNMSVCENEVELKKKIDQMFSVYKTPLIVEEFIDGRELSALVIETEKGLKTYIGEKVFNKEYKDGKYDLCSWDKVWTNEDAYGYEKFDDPKGRIKKLCEKVFNIFEASGYIKYDIRLDKDNKPYFIDININSSFGYHSAIDNVPKMYGVSFEDTLFEVILSARRKKFL